jgi:hypothetical protein
VAPSDIYRLNGGAPSVVAARMACAASKFECSIPRWCRVYRESYDAALGCLILMEIPQVVKDG